MSHNQQMASLSQTVQALEASGDTWHPSIAESLIDLAQLLQSEGSHEAALAILERVVHINRVNNGLFSLQQAPAIDMQVKSHMALDQWQEADSLRQYHFYIHSRSIAASDPALISALVTYAEWHLRAYADRRIDVMPVTRVVDAYQLYSVVLSLVEAQPDAAAWPREQYLRRLAFIAWQMSLSGSQMRWEVMRAGSRQVDDDWVASITNGQRSLRASTFVLGEEALQEVIAHRVAVLEAASPESPARRDFLKQHVEAVLDLADWHLLFMRRLGATKLYQQAWQMLAEEDEDLRKEVFGKIVSIPAFDEYLQPELLQFAGSQTRQSPVTASLQTMSATPTGATGHAWPWVDMRFDLTRYGQVDNIELLNSSTEINDSVRRRLTTVLRASSMRPVINQAGLETSRGWVFRFPYDPGRMRNNFTDDIDDSDIDADTTGGAIARDIIAEGAH